jgi:hypothetical protein
MDWQLGWLVVLVCLTMPIKRSCVSGTEASSERLSKGWENFPSTCGAMRLNQSTAAQLRNLHQVLQQHMQQR